MTDDEFGSRFAYTLGMMTALSREMLGRRFVLALFEERDIPEAEFTQLADVCQRISVGYYTEKKEKKQ